MLNGTTVYFQGNLAEDPELRFTQNGVPVANFRVIVNTRKFNAESNEWEDSSTLSHRCTVWRGRAENAAQTLRKGSSVIVVGTQTERSYETDEGETKYIREVEVDALGVTLDRQVFEIRKVIDDAPPAPTTKKTTRRRTR